MGRPAARSATNPQQLATFLKIDRRRSLSRQHSDPPIRWALKERVSRPRQSPREPRPSSPSAPFDLDRWHLAPGKTRVPSVTLSGDIVSPWPVLLATGRWSPSPLQQNFHRTQEGRTRRGCVDPRAVSVQGPCLRAVHGPRRALPREWSPAAAATFSSFTRQFAQRAQRAIRWVFWREADALLFTESRSRGHRHGQLDRVASCRRHPWRHKGPMLPGAPSCSAISAEATLRPNPARARTRFPGLVQLH